MLRHLTWCMESHINSNERSLVYTSGSGTYNKLTVLESLASECGKNLVHTAPKGFLYHLKRKDRWQPPHLHPGVAFLKDIYISLLKLGNELQFKCPREKMFQLTLWSSNRTKNCIALGTLLLSRRKAWQKQWALLHFYWATCVQQTNNTGTLRLYYGHCYWSPLSLPMFTWLPCTCFTIT